MIDPNPFASPQASLADTDPQPLQSETKYQGIRGWLRLVVLHLIGIMLSYALAAFGDFHLLMQWSDLQQGLGPLLILEMLVNLGMLCFAIYASAIMARHRAHFPAVMITLYVSRPIIWFVDALVASRFVGPNAWSSAPEAFQLLVACAFWIPYMCVSKRVKATFVN